MKSEDWISIVDKVPGNERSVLVWLEYESNQIGKPSIACYAPKENIDGNKDGWFLIPNVVISDDNLNFHVTHWIDIIMPED